MEHGDKMGNTGIISAGDVQWMTAGSGIIHQEMPQESPTGTMWGFQFWANLPASHKMIAPRYQEVKAAEIPEVALVNDVKIKVVAGVVSGVKGPVRDIIIEPEMLDIIVPPGTVFTHTLPVNHTAFIYVLDGEGYFDDRRDAYSFEVVGHGWSDLERRCICEHETVVLYEQTGNTMQVTTMDKPSVSCLFQENLFTSL